MKIFLFAMLLSGCASKGDPGEKGGMGPQGFEGPSGMMGPKGEQGPAGEKGADGNGAPTKVPHLIVVQSGEDLGPMIDRTTTWYAKAGGEVDWSTTSKTYFDAPNCGGKHYRIGGRASMRIMTENGLWKVNGPLQDVHYLSAKWIDVDGNSQCGADGSGPKPGFPIADMNMPATPYADVALTVEIR